ncbi:hypothetical protein [Stieleria varia]|uniref:Uncharacterized protein n=1 Tax=Stieleria varia TaxID=2528005 RepID=A0A5C5ZQW6_9BACT|nr:hypothetical protein [Stieleria varia]TWT89465.1 hypothetical protein Pla52n_67530 [Stieleria varia]
MTAFRAIRSLRIIACVLILHGITTPTTGKADDGMLSSKQGFHAIVLESVAARAEVSSGEFKYTIVQYQEEGEDFEWKKEGVFAYDERQSLSIHWFLHTFGKKAKDPNPWGATPGNGIAIQTDDGIQYRGGALFSPQLALARLPVSDRTRKIAVGTSPNTSLFVPFEWRAFGFAFYADVDRNTPFDKVIPNYLAAEEVDILEIKHKDLPKSFQPVVNRARYFNYGGCVLCVEVDRDYWVTRARFASPSKASARSDGGYVGESVISECTVYLEQVNGYWVPARALYKSGKRRLDFQMDWKFVNPPEGKFVFSKERLEENLQTSFVPIP